MRGAAVLASFVCLIGCHAQGSAAPPAPRTDLPTHEQLEALVIPPTGGQIAFAQCPYAPQDIPPIEDVRDVALPEFRADRSRASNYMSGDERLDEVALHEHMAPMQDEIMRCLDLAACYVEDAELVGEIAMELEVTSSGRVRSASVDVTEQLAVDPVIACTRRALAELRFPQIDGGNTFVSFAMTIE